MSGEGSKDKPSATGGANFIPLGRLPSLKPARKVPGAPNAAQPSTSSPKPTPKKSFVPNLNVTRATPASEEPSSSTPKPKAKKERQKREWTERPPRRDIQYIQTSSVFSEGVASQGMQSKSSGFRPSSGGPAEDAPKEGPKAEVSGDSLDNLLRTGFISDLPKNEHAPISLVKAAAQVKKEHDSLGSMSENEEEDVKYYLFQFPSILPFAKKEKASGEPEAACAEDERVSAARITDLDEGRIGCFQLGEDSRMKIEINQIVYDVEAGFDTNTSISLFNVDSMAGTMSHLADVSDKLICRPNVSCLLDTVSSSDSDIAVVEKRPTDQAPNHSLDSGGEMEAN